MLPRDVPGPACLPGCDHRPRPQADRDDAATVAAAGRVVSGHNQATTDQAHRWYFRAVSSSEDHYRTAAPSRRVGDRARPPPEPDGDKAVTIPLAPRAARASNLTIKERGEASVFLAADGGG